MAPFIYGIRNNIHIIDLAQTVPMLHRALQAVSDTVAGGGRVLFVGTKRQAAEPMTAAAKRSAQYYVNARWLGGMLTNWKTISRSIQRLRELERLLAGEAQGLTKKERLTLTRERDKLEKALGGIKDMGGVPDLHLRDRHQQGSDRDPGGQPPRHPGRRDRRFQLRPRPHHLSDPRQRRRRPGDHALLRPDRPGRDRRHLAAPRAQAGVDIGAQETSDEPASSKRRRQRRRRRWPTQRRSSRRPDRERRTKQRRGSPCRSDVHGAGGRARRSQEDHRHRPGARAQAQRDWASPSTTRSPTFTDEDVAKIDEALNLKGRFAARRLGGQAKRARRGRH